MRKKSVRIGQGADFAQKTLFEDRTSQDQVERSVCKCQEPLTDCNKGIFALLQATVIKEQNGIIKMEGAETNSRIQLKSNVSKLSKASMMTKMKETGMLSLQKVNVWKEMDPRNGKEGRAAGKRPGQEKRASEGNDNIVKGWETKNSNSKNCKKCLSSRQL